MHYLWQFRLLRSPLSCVSGEPVEVIHPGVYNRDGGPDFFNARIRIGQTTWAGNVEIHLRASDWYRHHHQEDPAYHNVILHVVDTCDADVTGADHCPIPVVEVRSSYPPELISRFEALHLASRWIPCQNILAEVDPAVFRLWAPALAVERLTDRARTIRTWLTVASFQWDEVAYQLVAGALGCKINTHPFELLARVTPLRILLRHRDHLTSLEAMLFGQAGLLDPSYKEAYPADLFRSYLFYRDKYTLHPLERGTLKFLRLRPVNFPTIRISQLAFLLNQRNGFPENFPDDIPLASRMKSLQARASSYWDTHYTFDRIAASRIKKLGLDTIRLVLINGLAPLLFLYGMEKNQDSFRERAVAILDELPGESSALINTWEKLGFPAGNALFTQALKQLKSDYCDRKRCLECRIGVKLLRRET